MHALMEAGYASLFPINADHKRNTLMNSNELFNDG